MIDSLNKKKDAEKGKGKPKSKGASDSVRRISVKVLPGWASDPRSTKFQRWALIAVTSFFAAFIMAPQHLRVHHLTVGEPAQETIVSPITFSVVDEAATNKNRDEVLKSVLPVYDFDDAMARDVQSRIVESFGFIRGYLVEEAEHRAREANKPQDAAPKEKTTEGKPFELLDGKTLRTRFENLLGAGVSPSAFAMLKEAGFSPKVEGELRSLVVPVLEKGVLASREMAAKEGKEGVLLWSRSKDKLLPRKDLSTVFDLKEAYNFITLGDRNPASDTGLSRSIRQIAMDLVNVNINYNREKTTELRQQALAAVKPVHFQVVKGEPIIRKGEPANEGHLKKLTGLQKANPVYSRYMILAGFALALIVLLRLSFYFSEIHLERAKHATDDLLLTCLLLIFTVLMVRFVAASSPLVISAGKISPRALLFAAPVATGAMLMSLMVDPRMAFVFAALGALIASLAVEGNVYLFFFYFMAGVVGLQGMTRVRDRTSILRAGLVVGLVNMVSVLAVKMALGELTRVEEFYQIGLGFVGGVLSGLLVSGLAPLLEPLGYITNVRLLEMANLNRPLLKELAMNAPGTYHHSIMVGNIAETAAEEIGANPLLTRVGALYHDIGKISKTSKPAYFIENQQRGLNPHDKLEPSMSALILVSHVKNGVEKAREFRLGAPIIDIIREHHGTNLIKYFYTKAVSKTGKTGQVISEDEYRYHGPLPQTKEAALVMLADTVEASSRTLSDPTPARIQKHVQSLVMGLFGDGQLDQSTLTLKDLHAITKSFVRAMQGILHSRIDYPQAAMPQEKGNGDISKQQAEKDRNRLGRTDEASSTAIRRLGL